MTGSLRHGRDAGSLPEDPYRRAVVRLDDGSDVAYRDVRRFGTWLLLEPASSSRTSMRASGRSHWSARSAHGARCAPRRRRAPVKAAILDQRTLAGVGNIYADEALWRARIHPLREAREPRRPARSRRSAQAIRDALELGIQRQGSTLRDYALPDGGSGGMQARVQGLRPGG